MLSSTALFHLDKLIPSSVQEASSLIELLENSLLFYMEKTGLIDVCGAKEIFCNRKHVHIQRQITDINSIPAEAHGEFYFLNVSIEKFVESIVTDHFLHHRTKLYNQINVECSLINKGNIALSYELY